MKVYPLECFYFETQEAYVDITDSVISDPVRTVISALGSRRGFQSLTMNFGDAIRCRSPKSKKHNFHLIYHTKTFWTSVILISSTS